MLSGAVGLRWSYHSGHDRMAQFLVVGALIHEVKSFGLIKNYAELNTRTYIY